MNLANVAIAFTVSGMRPGYLDNALVSWKRVRGFKHARLVFCCEPDDGCSEQVIMSRLSGHPSVGIISNTERRGVSGNTKLAFYSGLCDADYVIIAEEDLIVSDDILEYHRWAARRYHRDRQVSGICSFTRWSDDAPDRVVRAPFFNPLVWGTWLDRSELFLSSWAGGLGDAWDRHLLSGLVGCLGKEFIFPQCSRVQHIGKYGVHGTGNDAAFEATLSKCWRPRYGHQKYREVQLIDPTVRL